MSYMHNVETYTYSVLFQTEGGYKVFRFATDYTKDEVIDRFVQLANTHKLRGLMDVLALYPDHTLALYRSAEEIAFNVMHDSRMQSMNTQKPVYWEIDKQNRDYDADFLWDTSMVYARLNDTSDWIKVTEYPTDYAMFEHKANQLEGLFKECNAGKWFRKGSDYFKVLKDLSEYTASTLEAVGFEEVNEELLDALDEMLQKEHLHVEYNLVEVPDQWEPGFSDYVHRFNIVRLPEWLQS